MADPKQARDFQLMQVYCLKVLLVKTCVKVSSRVSRPAAIAQTCTSHHAMDHVVAFPA